MEEQKLEIGLVRRGFSASGGAEAYLRRFAAGAVEAGHSVHLFTTKDWPAEQWTYGALTKLPGSGPREFADRLEAESGCDVLLSLERVWRCDVFRAGDGVHRAWLERRHAALTPIGKLRAKFNRKHDEILRLEDSLLGQGRARRVIANSEMVKAEIQRFYGYATDRIDVVYNGVPLERFATTAADRARKRKELGLRENDVALLFVGSGWERKGLRFAIEAMRAAALPQLRLLVAGRGNERGLPAAAVQFLGVVSNLPELYAAADVFVLPTLYDPFSNASLEALASGLPVITTRANGFSEVIDEGVHGSVLPAPNDMDALVAALRFWALAERREQMRPRILERAARFDISVNVARTLAILRQTAASAAS